MEKISEALKVEDILKKGRKKQQFSEVKSQICQILCKDASLIQSEISSELNKFEVSITQSGISRILKDMEYTRKGLLTVPEEKKQS